MKHEEEETPKGAELSYIQALVIIFGLGVIFAILLHNSTL